MGCFARCPNMIVRKGILRCDIQSFQRLRDDFFRLILEMHCETTKGVDKGERERGKKQEVLMALQASADWGLWDGSGI